MTEHRLTRRDLLKVTAGSPVVAGASAAGIGMATAEDNNDQDANSTEAPPGPTAYLFATRPTALDPETGTELWHSNRMSGHLLTEIPPLVVEGSLYHGGPAPYAIDATTGDIQWEWLEPIEEWDPGGDEVLATFSQPVVVEGKVYYSRTLDMDKQWDGAIQALDAISGEEQWRFTDLPMGTSMSHVSVVNGTVYATYGTNLVEDDGKVGLLALDAGTGEIEWEIDDESLQLIPLSSDTPIVTENTVFVGFSAFDSETGEHQWRWDGLDELITNVSGLPLVVDSTVYRAITAGPSSDELHQEFGVAAIDAFDGVTEWTNTLPTEEKNITGNIHLGFDSGTLYAPLLRSKLYAFDADTGDIKWVYEPEGDTILGKKVNAGDGLVFQNWFEDEGSESGLVALDAATGDEEWTYNPNETHASTATIVDEPTGSSIGSSARFGIEGHHHTWADGETLARGTVRGTVTDVDGEPIKGIDVEFVEAGSGDSGPTPMTDEDGEFRASVRSDVTYDVTATGDEFEEETLTVTVAEDETTDLEFALERGGIITGSVTDPDDNPMPDATVEVEDSDTGETVESTTTDDDGSFELDVETGEFLLTATTEFFTAERSVTLTAGETRAIRVTLRLAVTEISGTVTFDQTGEELQDVELYLFEGRSEFVARGMSGASPGARPLADASTSETPLDDEPEERFVARATTDENGQYEMFVDLTEHPDDQYLLLALPPTDERDLEPELKTELVPDDPETEVDFDLYGRPLAPLEDEVMTIIEQGEQRAEETVETAGENFETAVDDLFMEIGGDDDTVDPTDVTDFAGELISTDDLDGNSSPEEITEVIAEHDPFALNPDGLRRIVREYLIGILQDELAGAILETATDELLDWLEQEQFAFDSKAEIVEQGYKKSPEYQNRIGTIENQADRFEDITDRPVENFDRVRVERILEEQRRQLENREYGIPGVVMLTDMTAGLRKYDQTLAYAESFDTTQQRIENAEKAAVAGQLAQLAGGALVVTGKGAVFGRSLMKAGTKVEESAELAQSTLEFMLPFDWYFTQTHVYVDLEELAEIVEDIIDWLDAARDREVPDIDSISIQHTDINRDTSGLLPVVRANRPTEGAFNTLGNITIPQIQVDAVEEATITVRNDSDDEMNVRTSIHILSGGLFGTRSISKTASMDPPDHEGAISIPAGETHTFEMDYRADGGTFSLFSPYTAIIQVWANGTPTEQAIQNFWIRPGLTFDIEDETTIEPVDAGPRNSAVRSPALAMTTAKKGHNQALTVSEFEEMQGELNRLVETAIDPETDVITHEHSPDKETTEVQYLLAGGGSTRIALQIEDRLGNRAGYDPATDTILEEIPGSTATGPDEIPRAVGVTDLDGDETFTLRVVAYRFPADTRSEVTIDAVENASVEPVLTISPTETSGTATPGETTVTTVEVAESAGRNDAGDIQVSAGEFTDSTGNSINVEAGAATPITVPAGTSKTVGIECSLSESVSMPEVSTGTRITGPITISSENAGTLDVSISLLVISTEVDGARLTRASQSVTGIELLSIPDETIEGLSSGTTVHDAYELTISGEGLVELELPLDIDDPEVTAVAVRNGGVDELQTQLQTTTARVTIDHEGGTEQIALVSNRLAPYLDDDGTVTTSGLRDAIDDWRAGDIETDMLREVIDLWRSGESVE